MDEEQEGAPAARRYLGTETDVINKYSNSIHGKGLTQSGLVVTATCTDCHTAHQELPASDPDSTVHEGNIAATCGTCHPGAGASFAIGAVHVLPGKKAESHPSVYWARIVYLWLIGLTIGFTARLVFGSFELAGEAIGLQMGLSFAGFFDPQSGQANAVGRFVGTIALLAFVAVNGPLAVIATVIQSLDVFPPGDASFAFLA